MSSATCGKKKQGAEKIMGPGKTSLNLYADRIRNSQGMATLAILGKEALSGRNNECVGPEV